MARLYPLLITPRDLEGQGQGPYPPMYNLPRKDLRRRQVP